MVHRKKNTKGKRNKQRSKSKQKKKTKVKSKGNTNRIPKQIEKEKEHELQMQGKDIDIFMIPLQRSIEKKQAWNVKPIYHTKNRETKKIHKRKTKKEKDDKD